MSTWRICLLAYVAAASVWGQAVILDTRMNGATLPLPNLIAGSTYVLTASAGPLANPVRVTLRDGSGILVTKQLHAGDLDLTTAFRVRATLGVRLETSAAAPLSVRITSWGVTRTLEAEPNNRREEANPLALGETVYGSGDDALYTPLPGTASPDIKKAAYEAGQDWFRLDFTLTQPKLVFFQLELPERDQIPADLALFTYEGGKLTPYAEGEDPVTFPHEVQAMNGNKFTTRLLRKPGTYYVRVIANHPEYRLRTRVYDPPPYQDPRQAVRTAVDYLLGAGDSWHANTPRRGGLYDRISSAHQETSLCVACHVTHFTLRGQLYANRNGYAVNQREQLQFLTERFYNNPRPLFGFEEQGAAWARVISAPANVLGRMSHLLDLYERQVSHERRERFHGGVREYLKLYYQDRTKLPPNETNGNQPLVSAYEVAWYAWEATKDPAIAALVTQNDIKDLIDLCYQTLALAAIDREKYAEQVKANAFRILSLQRASGQWSMKFAASEKEVEFQTGHALWALHAAGIPVSNPQVKKGLAYLLTRQQEFGGWLDPLQSFENFRTPFRETQMAVLALSSYYPELAPARAAANDPNKMSHLDLLNSIWSLTSSAQAKELEKEASHPDAFVRQQAVEVLGRLAHEPSLPLLLARLGDPSKRVQRSAAWAVRQIQSRRGVKALAIVQALDSPDARVRWGAVRVFAQHFSALAETPEFVAALERRLADPNPAIQNQAIQGLWQFWFWTPQAKLKDQIENALLRGLTGPRHPWAEQALREGIYNITDENIRYLYNNWVPAISRKEDQERVIRGRLAIEDRLSRKYTEFLVQQPAANKKRLLAALVELPLRRGDVYDPKSDLARGFEPMYQRIGNDIEQSVFFGEANTRFAEALVPLVNSPDAELRRLALGAAQLTRDARFGGVSAIAGTPGPARDQLVAAAKADPVKPENRELLRAFNALPRPPASAKTMAQRTATRPDEAFFRGYVEPIFNKRGADGQACAHCHSTHSIFNATYSTVFNVVNLEDPEQSPLLVKPTSNAETEGTLGARSHGGGVRFERDSPEYNTILNWLRGAKE